MDRAAIEAALDRVVREHRFTIAVVFPAVGAVLFLASHGGWLPAWLAFNPALVLAGTLVMRSPLIAGLAPLVDRHAAVGLLAVTAYTYAIEFVAVTTGIPYGHFVYETQLGPMVFGMVPAALPIFFVPLVVNAFLLSVLLLGRGAGTAVRRFALALGILVLVDLVLDPAAVSLGFWRYLDGGLYYGVPISNYAGWLLSGAVAIAAIDFTFGWRALQARLETCPYLLDDLVSFTVLWGLVNAVFGNWIPVVLTVLLVGTLVRVDRFDLVVPRWMEGV